MGNVAGQGTLARLAMGEKVQGIGRRGVLAGAGGLLGAPAIVRAQTALPVIGFIGTTSPAVWRKPVASFEQRLSELSWAPGRTITIDYRWTEGREDKAREAAEALVARKVDVIVAGGNAVPAAKRATTTIPIVFPVAIDPVGGGLVDNLARPGGNVTGLSLQGTDLAGKRLELLRRIVSGLRRLAIMANPDYPASAKELAEAEAAARALGLETVALRILRAEDIEPALAGRPAVDALYVVGDAIVTGNINRVCDLALKANLPTVLSSADQLAFGGLMGYGPNTAALFRRAAEYVDKILRGAKPGDLPVEQPTKFELGINLKTARSLGLGLTKRRE
jgi:putative tryptophan/tyrosine transport system substrate-binding protein